MILFEKNTGYTHKPYARGLFFFRQKSNALDRVGNEYKSSLSLSIPELPQQAKKIPPGGDAVYHY